MLHFVVGADLCRCGDVPSSGKVSLPRSNGQLKRQTRGQSDSLFCRELRRRNSNLADGHLRFKNTVTPRTLPLSGQLPAHRFQEPPCPGVPATSGFRQPVLSVFEIPPNLAAVDISATEIVLGFGVASSRRAPHPIPASRDVLFRANAIQQHYCQVRLSLQMATRCSLPIKTKGSRRIPARALP